MYFAEICKQVKKRKHEEEEGNEGEDEGAALKAGDFELNEASFDPVSKLDVT